MLKACDVCRLVALFCNLSLSTSLVLLNFEIDCSEQAALAKRANIVPQRFWSPRIIDKALEQHRKLKKRDSDQKD